MLVKIKTMLFGVFVALFVPPSRRPALAMKQLKPLTSHLLPIGNSSLCYLVFLRGKFGARQ